MNPYLLKGPVQILDYSSLDGKRVVLMGDFHVVYPTCPNLPNSRSIWVHEFLANVANDCYRENIPLDIFLETAYVDKKHGIENPKILNIEKKINSRENVSFLEWILYTFKDCFTPLKTNCPLRPIIDFHYVDVRLGEEKFKKTVLIMTSKDVRDMLFKELSSFNRDSRKEILYNTFLTELKNILMFNPSGVMDILVNEIKQLKDEEIKDKIISFYNSIYQVSVMSILNIHNKPITEQDIDNFIGLIEELIIDNDRENFEALVDKIEDNYLGIVSALMDIYLMCRLFRKNVKNAIIYCGRLHNDSYKIILEDLGFKLNFSASSEKPGVDFQCIDISKLPVFTN